MSEREQKLEALGYPLERTTPEGNLYDVIAITGTTVYASGHVAFDGAQLASQGKVPSQISIEDATCAAALCAANVLRTVRRHVGSLDRIERVVRITGYVNSDSDFTDQHLVINGASQLVRDVFGEAGRLAAEFKGEFFVWCKSGGPYLRAAFMRGEEQFWLDVAEDPDWTRAFVNRVADHITAVAIEGMKRFGLLEKGIAIYDDACSSNGPFVGPKFYESIFLPALRRMVKAYKDAGARWVMHHCDGNALPLLDMWVDAGIDAINPVEFHVGMDPVKIKQKYGKKLVCVGGLDNCAILQPRSPNGSKENPILVLPE